MGIRLQDAVIDGLADRPTPLYFHLYRQANYALDRAAFEAAELLQSAGYASLAVPASQIICRRPMVGHISHKLIGWAAGLGWIGRSTLLVHPQFGARMRYVTVLTDAALPPGRPIQQDCGPCRDCIAACPAHAIGETREQFGLDACFEKLTEFSKLEGIGQHICGICVRACRGG
jgi:epoxyqueuosine reductase QueG